MWKDKWGHLWLQQVEYNRGNYYGTTTKAKPKGTKYMRSVGITSYHKCIIKDPRSREIRRISREYSENLFKSQSQKNKIKYWKVPSHKNNSFSNSHKGDIQNTKYIIR